MLKVNIDSFKYQATPNKVILEDISFSINKGEHLVLLGESGCGKSTLLHLIYGLESLKNSEISWSGKTLLGPSFSLIPGEPFMKLVSQQFDLMPFISVAENIASHLNRRDKESDNKRVDELLNVVDLSDFKATKAKHLSGGQKQRVAIAKALAKAPEVLLLDEPFSNIDNFLKNKLRRNLFAYLKEKNITCITATHDSEEALSFADTVLVLKDGKKECFGNPTEIYNSLSNKYVAGFFGDVSEIEGTFFKNTTSKTEVLLPHQLKISEEKTAIEVEIINTEFKGSYYLIISKFNKKVIYFQHFKSLKTGIKVYLKKV
ncbi:ABC transporter ATP-binding protein [Patiriisocius marinistellae]|uniref:ABC transporter ATP-binding protein n=1 Tax=Patiriisocius marinistellae TaxID=2494560 RepID=A0A5J4FTH3_9FLAO|nr:ABC transporter ATP-binding protein [Patiriisocius marinistellae]GEQ84920.1 ABC transporter ATP-binding protein [Patiriisocius marinistellae]